MYLFHCLLQFVCDLPAEVYIPIIPYVYWLPRWLMRQLLDEVVTYLKGIYRICELSTSYHPLSLYTPPAQLPVCSVYIWCSPASYLIMNLQVGLRTRYVPSRLSTYNLLVELLHVTYLLSYLHVLYLLIYVHITYLLIYLLITYMLIYLHITYLFIYVDITYLLIYLHITYLIIYLHITYLLIYLLITYMLIYLHITYLLIYLHISYTLIF